MSSAVNVVGFVNVEVPRGISNFMLNENSSLERGGKKLFISGI